MSERLDEQQLQSQPREPLVLLGDLLSRLAEVLGPADGVAPEALDAGLAARLCGVSRSKWHAMNAEGLAPSPVELGDRCPRWLRSELLAWLRSGAPPRLRWLALRDSAMRHVG
jgi:predicted DNA-binding transcriptional regulator AlpA